MTMQRRHFELIAEVIRYHQFQDYDNGCGDLHRYDMAQHFANTLRATNPNFNRDRFLRACGVDA